MAKHKGRDVEVMQHIPANTEDKVLVKNPNGTKEYLDKKDLKLEHTQHLSKHSVPTTVKDTTVEDLQKHRADQPNKEPTREQHLRRL